MIQAWWVHVLYVLYAGTSICRFVCLEVFVPLEKFSLKWRRHYYYWRAYRFSSILGTYRAMRVLSLDTLTWHDVSVSYTSVTESFGVELSLLVLTTYMYVCCGWDSNTHLKFMMPFIFNTSISRKVKSSYSWSLIFHWWLYLVFIFSK